MLKTFAYMYVYMYVHVSGSSDIFSNFSMTTCKFDVVPIQSTCLIEILPMMAYNILLSGVMGQAL